VKVVATIALFAVCLFGGAVLSTVITVGAWQIQIEPRAFQCWDDVGIFDTYWENIDEHRGAGDKVSVGWTWDEIKTARELYIVAFYAIWAAGSLIPFRFILRRGAATKTLHATAAAPGS
jgi:hypothetical protein